MIPDILYLHKEVAKILKPKLPANLPLGVADQKNPAYPSWVSYRLTDPVQIGHSEEGYINALEDDFEYKTQSLWKIELEIVSIGDSALQNILSLAHQFNKPHYLDLFKNIGLCFLHKTNIKYAPRVLSTGIEPRHMFCVVFNMLVDDIDEIDSIDIVEVETEILDVDDSVLYQDVIEIDI